MEQREKNCVFMPDDSDMNKLSELYKAMGDFTRMKILWALMRQEYCVTELSTQMNMSGSAISHQLKILKMARLVASHKVGKNVFYTLCDEHIKWILEETYAHISER